MNSTQNASSIGRKSPGLRFGFAVFLFFTITATIITFILPPVYSSMARIKLQLPMGTNSDGTVRELYDPIAINTELAMLSSEKNLDRAIEHLKLSDKWTKKYEMPQPLAPAQTREILKRRIEIRPERSTTLGDITVFSDDPKEAAEIANAMAQQYQESKKPLGHMEVLLVDKAEERPVPVKPNKPLNICMGAVLGLIFAGLSGFVVNFLNTRSARRQDSQNPPPTVPQVATR
jgi:uncharacterized protein involved in exopolysaccharide biosynthesis